MMTHKEQFYNTVERKLVDRPATWLGMPVPEACEGLYSYFQVDKKIDFDKAMESAVLLGISKIMPHLDSINFLP
jgi:uroporphyrinogen decarboxylase